MSPKHVGWTWPGPFGASLVNLDQEHPENAERVYTLPEPVENAAGIEHVTQAVRLELKPGDTVAIYHPGRLTNGQREQFQAWWANANPGTRAIVLDGGLTIGAILAGESL